MKLISNIRYLSAAVKYSPPGVSATPGHKEIPLSLSQEVPRMTSPVHTTSLSASELLAPTYPSYRQI